MLVSEALYLGDRDFDDRLAGRPPQPPAEAPRGDVGFIDHALPPPAERGAGAGPAGRRQGVDFGEVLEEASGVVRDFLAGV